MKDRIVYPQLWLDEKFAGCSIPTKLLFMYLITNLQLGLSKYLHITDRQILFDTGLTPAQLTAGKKELIELKWIFFTENWVYHNHKCAYTDYSGQERVMNAKEREVASVPTKIREYFNKLTRDIEEVANPLQTSQDRVTNPAETKNQELETKGVVKGGKVDIGEFLQSPPDEILEKFSKKFKATRDQVKKKAEDMYWWWRGLSVARRKGYSDPEAILRNALKKDFGERSHESSLLRATVIQDVQQTPEEKLKADEARKKLQEKLQEMHVIKSMDGRR